MSNNNSEDDDRGRNNNQRDDAMRNDCKVFASADDVADARFLEAMVESGIEKVMQMGLEYFPKGLIKHALRNFQDTKTGTVDVEAAVTWLLPMGSDFWQTTCTCTRTNDILRLLAESSHPTLLSFCSLPNTCYYYTTDKN